MIDSSKIIDSITALDVSSLAKEEGANLVDGWIQNYAQDTDRIIAVECGWSLRLEEYSWAVGVLDLIAEDEKGIFGDEHKSTKEPSRYWTEDKWLESIKYGPQIGVYALALRSGEFYDTQVPGLSPQIFLAEYPVRIRVRAAVKTAVPTFWPREAADGWQEFDERALNTIENALRLKCQLIRAARKSGLVPWQLVGRQCQEFNRACEYYEKCKGFDTPPVRASFDCSDPAAKLALPFLPPEAQSPEAVIISASSYQTYTTCMEKGRREAMEEGKESNLAMDTGTALHTGLACWYRQIQEEQGVSNEKVSG